MVAQRFRPSRPVLTFRTAEQQRRALPLPLPLLQVPGYSHINTQPTPADYDKVNRNQTEDFVRRDSVHNDIEDSLLLPSYPSSAAVPTRPRTFAEAAMSTRRSSPYTTEDNPDPTLPKPMSLEYLGPIKCTFKKKKAAKWTPFDLGAADSTSEGGSTSDLGSLSRLPSPIPVTASSTSTTTTTSTSTFTSTIPRASTTTSHPPPSPASSFPTLQEAKLLSTASIHKQQTRTGIDFTPVVAGLHHAPDETNIAPSEDLFRLPVPNSFDRGRVVLNQQHTQAELHRSDLDTRSIYNHADEAMSSTPSIDPRRDKEGSSKSYDCVEWDPSLPSVPAQLEHPKPAATPAQPIAYTTVGSIIDPNAAPHFTAPNRIQREGSGRRPLVPLMQSHQHDSFYPQRGHSPFNATNALHHAHQLEQYPTHFGFSHIPPPNATRSTRPTRPLQQITSLTEQDKSSLAKIQGTTAPQMFSGNQQSSLPTPIPLKTPHLGLPPAISQPSFRAEEPAADGDLGRYTNFHGPVQGPVQGLEKMQTLQRLAKFENPMQSHALSRLSEFSVSKAQGTAVTLPNPIEELLRCKDQSSSVTSSKAEESIHNASELDRVYRFPFRGIADPSKPQANPLFGAFSPSTMRSSNDPRPHQPGYPAPLTAGPPGHRQYQGTANKALADYPDNHWGTDPRSSTFNPHGGTNPQASSLWSNAYNPESAQKYADQDEIPSRSGGARRAIQDTVSIEVASKYYPSGLPPDMTGNFVPLPYATQKKMGQIPNDPEPQTSEEKAAKKSAALENWFYGGQRRFAGMTAGDHIREYEERQLESLNPFGPIGPRPKIPLTPTQQQPFTIEEMNKMSIADAAAPLLDAAFSSLLSYATPANAPDSAKVLSKFQSSPAWLLDTSKNGNKSFYGGDWGVPPKRNGGGPGYR